MEAKLTALLAPIAGGKRYWVRVPQGTAAPYLLLNKVSDIPAYTMSAPIAHAEARVQIDIYATTFTALASLSTAVKNLLSGYRDEEIQGIFIDSERNLPAADAGDVTNLFRTSIDINIHYGD